MTAKYRKVNTVSEDRGCGACRVLRAEAMETSAAGQNGGRIRKSQRAKEAGGGGEGKEGEGRGGTGGGGGRVRTASCAAPRRAFSWSALYMQRVSDEAVAATCEGMADASAGKHVA
jgi:hypothetical protein